jgi:hypothetical protein
VFSEELNKFINIQIEKEKEQLICVLNNSISKAWKETFQNGWSTLQGFTVEKIINAHAEFLNSFSSSVWDIHVVAVKEFDLPADEYLFNDLKNSLEFYLADIPIDWYRPIRRSGHTLTVDEIEDGNAVIEEIKYGAYITKVREAEAFVILRKQQQKKAK